MDMINCVGVIHSVCLEEVEVLDAFNEGMNFRVPQTILGDIFCLLLVLVWFKLAWVGAKKCYRRHQEELQACYTSGRTSREGWRGNTEALIRLESKKIKV